MRKEKIFELRIDEEDELSGIDSISLVDEPAIEINWVAFKKQQEDFHVPDGEDEHYLNRIFSKGQSEQELLDEGWEVDSIEEIGQHNFAGLQTTPNDESAIDTDFYRVRFKYGLSPNISQNPIIPTTREYCRVLINRNYVFRLEDILSLSPNSDPEDGGNGQSPQFYRGGFNCRHKWFRILYKKSGDIVNKASININKIKDDAGRSALLTPEWSQPSTITEKTRNNPSPETRKNLGFSEENFESYTDYPEGAVSNAKRALEWVDKHGWGSCGEDTGKQRANQLANKEPISRETIARMAAFKRHQQHKDVPYSEGCGGLMWDAWGGDAGINWAQRKLEEIDKEKMSKEKFEIEDEEQRTIVGVAMVPDKLIFRKDRRGNPYYVTFRKEEIAKIMRKYMKNKYTDNNDLDHNGKAVKDVYVIESWIVEDELYDKSRKYGFDVKVGSWMVSMKIAKTPEGDKVWERVKDGSLRGYSVSGWFEEIEQFGREEMFLKEVAKILTNLK